MIPVYIERRDELEAVFATFKPLSVQTQVPLLRKFYPVIVFALAAAMFGAFIVENRLISTMLGLLYLGVTGYSFFVMHRSKNVDRRLRLTSYVSLIPAAVIVWRMINQWMA